MNVSLKKLTDALNRLQAQINALGSGSGSSGVQSIVPGTGIDVDATDPANPVVSATATASAVWKLGYINATSSDNNFSPAPATIRNAVPVSTLFKNAVFGVYNGSPSKVGVVIGASPSAAGQVSEVWIGKGKASSQGFLIDFDGTPTQLTFGGAAGVSLTAGQTAKSDAVAIPAVASGDTLVVAINLALTHIQGSGGAVTGFASYFKTGVADASSLTTSGYTTSSWGINGINGIYLL